MQTHVHFGAGQFGLGFVCWLSKFCKYQTVLVNRDQSKTDANSQALSGSERLLSIKQNGFFLVNFNNNGQLYEEKIQIDKALFTSDRAGIAKYIASPDCSLITTSVKYKSALLDSYLEIIIEGIRERIRNKIRKKLYVIACENAFSSSDIASEIRNKIDQNEYELFLKHVLFVNAVVDRICTQIPDQNYVRIGAESYGKIFLPKQVASGQRTVRMERIEGQVLNPNPGGSLVDINKKRIFNYIEFVDDIEKYKKLKIGIVNGGHLLIAINAYSARFTQVAHYVRENNQFCEGVLMELAALSILDIDNKLINHELSDAAREMAQHALSRFSYVDDLVNRVIERFVDPFIGVEEYLSGVVRNPIDYQAEFFRNLNYKVLNSAYEMLTQYGKTPKFTFITICRLTKLIENAAYIRRSILRSS